MIEEKRLYEIKVDGVRVFVDELGNIGRLDKIGRFRWLKQHDCKSNSTENPYKRVSINGKSYYAHRIALGAFSGGIIPNLQVDHLSGDKSENSRWNLSWKTARGQAQNKRRDGRCTLPPIGEIRVNNRAFKSYQELAAFIGVSYTNLRQWVDIFKNDLSGRMYHGFKFDRVK